MEMLQQQYQVKEFIQFTAGEMKTETEDRSGVGGSQEQSPLVTGVLSLCIKLDMCAACDMEGTLG